MFRNNVPPVKNDKILSKCNIIKFSALPQCIFRHFRLYQEFFFIYLFIYFSPSTRVHVVPFTGGLLLLLKATGAAREPTPRPFTTVGEPIPRTGRHWELNPVPLDLQTNALPTELTGRNFEATPKNHHFWNS